MRIGGKWTRFEVPSLTWMLCYNRSWPQQNDVALYFNSSTSTKSSSPTSMQDQIAWSVKHDSNSHIPKLTVQACRTVFIFLKCITKCLGSTRIKHDMNDQVKKNKWKNKEILKNAIMCTVETCTDALGKYMLISYWL